jgi:hypothetical protein
MIGSSFRSILALFSPVLGLVASCDSSRSAVDNESSGPEAAEISISAAAPTEKGESSEATLEGYFPLLRRESNLLDIRIDNFFRDEDRYFEEIVFWMDLVLLPAEGDDLTVALNSAPQRDPSAFYEMKDQASLIMSYFDQIDFNPATFVSRPQHAGAMKIEPPLPDWEPGHYRDLDVVGTHKKASDILAMATPFTGSNLIDLQTTMESEPFDEFQKAFASTIQQIATPVAEDAIENTPPESD